MGEEAMKDLGIVICNFNKIDYLRNCLLSMNNADFNKISYDIIVVDNASNDGSCEMLESEFPDVILLKNTKNIGGAGGFATGMNYVLRNKYRYLSILDNDTRADSKAFINLKKYLDKNPNVGVVGATIMQMDEPEKIQEMGALLDYKEFEFILNYNDRIIDDSIPEIVECDYVPACCFMTRLEVLEKVGVFDETYFIYWDDIDWCTRVKKIGYDIHAISSSKIWHKGGAKLAINTFPTYFYYRNLIRFFIKNIDENKIEYMAEKISNLASRIYFYNDLKSEYSHTIAFLMGIDDAYANNIGPKWDAVIPRIRKENLLYTRCQGKKVALFDCEDFPKLKSIIKNLISIDAKLTIYIKYNNKNYLEKYFPMINIKEYKDYLLDKNNFDFTIQSLTHISDNEIKDKTVYYLDAYSNYLMDEIDFKNLEKFYVFKKSFNSVYKEIFYIKFLNLKKMTR
jgi:GT2 family glycosyltransferase